MQNMADIKRRIKSVSETRQITKAMHLISTVKMRKAMVKYDANAAYLDRIRVIIKDILTSMGRDVTVTHPFIRKTEGKHTAYLVIAGDKGLAGAYNINVLKLALQHIQQIGESYIFTVGHIATEFFTRRGYLVDIEFLHTAQDPTLYNTQHIAEVLLDLYSQNLIDRVIIVYTHMVSTIKQEPRAFTLLPMDLQYFMDVELDESYVSGQTEYEPSARVVLDAMAMQFMVGAVYSTLVQSYASEQSARMEAMNSATKNADKMINRLQMDYRRARQAAITNEMLEIVNGTNAVTGAER